ncbi:glutaredoxin family protein [Altererythrobacter sp. H2]|uniref:glutaredoxin family protein n=1 Tax=Altererythrobacter sp. H2 TaxID=3108391 RepID=UPI002B4BC86C|nr:glutaredoxin family protein [Altererythrobacter sp. H2]WRK95050.1 glutaredoxin family protein [Altererythrobacter sp. H2]
MSKSATIYRMVMDGHICPWGLKSLHVLRSNGFAVDDRWLATRSETDAFKEQHGVTTTPQVFIDGQRIGGHDDLLRYLGKPVRDPEALTYAPVVAIFAMAAFMALAAHWVVAGTLFSVLAAEWFIAFSMCLLALQKLRDVESFATQFLGYDLLAQRWVPYARLYPWLEGLAGVLMIAGALHWLSVPVALFIGSIGAVSVFYAVYIQKRELKCACVGGNSNVPLGFVSLTENLMMIAMALWMVAKPQLL